MLCFPISLCLTSLLMAGAVLWYRPAAREEAARRQGMKAAGTEA